VLSRSLFGFLFAVFAAGLPIASQADARAMKPKSQEEMEKLVRADAARRMKVSVDEVRIAETTERTWPDRGLGCNARRGVLEPMPTPGYRIVVHAGTRRLIYHTDRFGRMLRCAPPVKPLDPIK
jgi:hypothetical protein